VYMCVQCRLTCHQNFITLELFAHFKHEFSRDFWKCIPPFHSPSHTHTHAHTHTLTYLHTHTCAHVHSHTHTRTRTPARLHANTHTHMRAHTHAPTLVQGVDHDCNDIPDAAMTLAVAALFAEGWVGASWSSLLLYNCMALLSATV